MQATETDYRVPSITSIIRLRDKLVDNYLFSFNGLRLDANNIQVFAESVCKAMPKVKSDVVYDSMEHMAGQGLTPRILREIAWRLSGNKKSLEQQEPVHPWTVQRELEWAPVQIISCQPEANPRSKFFGANYALRVMAGSACPLIVVKWWSAKFAKSLAIKGGYTRRRNKYPFQDISELVNMRFLVQLEPKLSRGKPGFAQITCASSLMKWNRQIIQKRFRKKGRENWPCPMRYTHPCFKCHIGYLDCEAAVHRDTFERNNDGNSIPPERV